MKASDYRAVARQTLSSNRKPAVIASLVYLAICALISCITSIAVIPFASDMTTIYLLLIGNHFDNFDLDIFMTFTKFLLLLIPIILVTFYFCCFICLWCHSLPSPPCQESRYGLRESFRCSTEDEKKFHAGAQN